MYIPADFSEIKSTEQVKRALEMKVGAYFAERTVYLSFILSR